MSTELKKTGIYKIVNTKNNKCYIGSAAGKNGIYQRFQDHKKTLRGNRHRNKHLQRAWNKYGEKSFQFEIIEFCNKDECIKKEQFYIDSLIPDYNICKIAGSTIGQNCEDFMTKEAILIKRKKQSKNISLALSGVSKTDNHAIKCGAKYFNVYKSRCVQVRKRGQQAIYEKGRFIGKWLKINDCATSLGVNDRLIRRCLQGNRPQTCGYIFEFLEV